MKKWIVLAAFVVAGFVSPAIAGDPVSVLKGQPESTYDVTHSTVAISSTTVSTDAAVSGYRAVYVYNLSQTSTIYYYLGGSPSTTTVTSLGWPIFPKVAPTVGVPVAEKIEYNGLISYRLAPGAVTSVDVPKKVIRK